MRACLHQIQTFNSKVVEFITVTGERALDEARQAEREILAGLDCDSADNAQVVLHPRDAEFMRKCYHDRQAGWYHADGVAVLSMTNFAFKFAQ